MKLGTTEDREKKRTAAFLSALSGSAVNSVRLAC